VLHLRSHPAAMPRAHSAVDPMVSAGFCRGRTDAYGLGENELEGALSQRRAASQPLRGSARRKPVSERSGRSRTAKDVQRRIVMVAQTNARNRANRQASARARVVHSSQGPVKAEVELVREFLRREFRECHHLDFFAFDERAQVLIIETPRGYWHMLVIPNATFESPDFARLCNANLAATLALVRESRVILTPQGPLVGA
jgi:hypothetical protein